MTTTGGTAGDLETTTAGRKDDRRTKPRDERRSKVRARGRSLEIAAAVSPDRGVRAKARAKTRAKTIGSKLAVVPRACGDQTPRKASPWVAEQAQRLATACTAMAAGFRACAKHTRNEALAESALTMALEQESLAGEVVRIGAALGVSLRRTSGMSESLRWEWLASTATLLDGSSDVRVLAECLRWMRAACDAARGLELVSSHGAWELSSNVRAVAVALDRACGNVGRFASPRGSSPSEPASPLGLTSASPALSG